MIRLRLLAALASLALAVMLLVIVIAEPYQRQVALAAYHERASAQAVALYVQHCVNCHGVAGEGIDIAPALADIRGKDEQQLFLVIERGRRGADMAAFSINEGGSLTEPQIESLVVLINYGSWEAVSRRAAELNIAASWTPTPTVTPTETPTGFPTPTETPQMPTVSPSVSPTMTPAPPLLEIMPTGTPIPPVIQVQPSGTPIPPIFEIIPTATVPGTFFEVHPSLTPTNP